MKIKFIKINKNKYKKPKKTKLLIEMKINKEKLYKIFQQLLQIKMRIIKALKFKPNILAGYNEPSIIHHLNLLEDCMAETQVIGSRYGNKQNLKDSNFTESIKQIEG